MNKGDIVLIPFPFTDLTGLKNRPALVLINSESDLTAAFISSQTKSTSEFDLLISPSPENGLKKTSIVKVTKLATLEKSLILGRMGSLSSSQMKKVEEYLILAFQLLPKKFI